MPAFDKKAEILNTSVNNHIAAEEAVEKCVTATPGLPCNTTVKHRNVIFIHYNLLNIPAIAHWAAYEGQRSGLQ